MDPTSLSPLTPDSLASLLLSGGPNLPEGIEAGGFGWDESLAAGGPWIATLGGKASRPLPPGLAMGCIAEFGDGSSWIFAGSLFAGAIRHIAHCANGAAILAPPSFETAKTHIGVLANHGPILWLGWAQCPLFALRAAQKASMPGAFEAMALRAHLASGSPPSSKPSRSL